MGYAGRGIEVKMITGTRLTAAEIAATGSDDWKERGAARADGGSGASRRREVIRRGGGSSFPRGAGAETAIVRRSRRGQIWP